MRLHTVPIAAAMSAYALSPMSAVLPAACSSAATPGSSPSSGTTAQYVLPLIEATSAVVTAPLRSARWRIPLPPPTEGTCARSPRLCVSLWYARVAADQATMVTERALEVSVSANTHVSPTDFAELRYRIPGTGLTVIFVTW